MGFTKYDDIIDSREIIERIEELETDRDSYGPLDEEDAEELAVLLRLAEQGEDAAPDWQYGETLIRDDYFRSFAQELAEDCGLLESDAFTSWPGNCIDWEQAASDLQHDYTPIDYDGVTYWVR